jgi:hypothetical protein
MKAYLALVLSAALSGCVAAEKPTTFAATTTDTYDQATGVTIKEAPYVSIGGGGYTLGRYSKGGETDYTLTLAKAGNDWGFYSSAFADGVEYDLIRVDQKIGNCSQYGCAVGEIVKVIFTTEQLRPYLKKPLNLSIIGTRDRVNLTIPSNYIALVVTP